MSAMSASPPVGLPLSLIAEHKVAGNKPPPAATPQQVSSIAPVAAAPPVAPAPPAIAPQPQTNGMEPAPPTPAVAPPAAAPPVSSSPPSPPQPVLTTASNNAQAVSQTEGAPVAPGSGTSTSGGSGEVEGSTAAVGDVPPADAQPSVPPTPATVPPGDQPSQEVVVAPGQAVSPAPAAAGVGAAAEVPAQASPAPIPSVQPVPAAPVEASPPPPSAPAALPPATPPPPQPQPQPVAPPLLHQDNVQKPSRTLKRKLQPTEGEASMKKAQKVEEPAKSEDDGRKSKRSRLPTQPYQSPIPELNMIAKMNNTPKTPKASEEKLIVFYRNEFLAVRNAEGGFYVCQTMQNIYRSAPGHRSKIKIRWFSQGPNDVFTPDFYDSTEFDCILTNLNLDRLEKDKYKLPAIEKQRTESILKRAIDAEKGVQSADTALTEEHPDGLDLSLYRHEDQLKKRRKKKESSKKKAKSVKTPGEVKKPMRTSARNSGGSTEEPVYKEKTKTNEKSKSRLSKKKKIIKKNEKASKKKEPEVTNNKKEPVEAVGRKTANSGASQVSRKSSDKTKSAVGAKQTGKAPTGATKQPDKPAQRQTRTATPKQ